MSRRLLALTLLAAALAGCADRDREPALAALRAADAAVLGLDPQAESLAPEEVRAARVAREVALAAAGRKDWKGAREVALGVPEKARRAVDAALARRAERARAWAQAKVDVPNLLYALEDRLDDLDEVRSLPPGLDRPALVAARAELDATRTAWEGLAPAAGAGDPAAEVERAGALKARVLAVLERVGIR
jgi:hypothetical protein